MADYYLKNSTGSTKEVADLGIVIADGQSITISKDDFDGYLTTDLIAALSDDPALGLVLSTTDIGNTSGDLPKSIAVERLSLSHKWKPAVAAFANLPTVGNEDDDVRLVRDTGVLYRWKASASMWDKITSTFSLSVTEYDEDPIGSEISKLVFVQPEDSVYIDANTAYIGPPNAPLTLAGQSLTVAGTSFVTGRLSDLNVNYKSGDPAGTNVTYITNDSTFTLSTPDTANRCNYGDKGTLSVYINGTRMATMDLGANFAEARRETTQLMSNWDIAGTGDPTSNGITAFVGTGAGKGSLEMLSVGVHNGFKYYQRWNARINITDPTLLRQGYNQIQLIRSGLTAYGGDQIASVDVFYDTDVGNNPTCSTPTVTVEAPVLKYLSGVSFFNTGSTFSVDVTGSHLFDNVYHTSEAPVELYGWPGMATASVRYDDAVVSGVSIPPKIDETLSISNYMITQTASQMSSDARLSARPRDPYGVYTAAQSASGKIMVFSYPTASDALTEYFRDEAYRLRDGSYDTVPASITGQWDSTGNLGSYDDGKGLQVYMDGLYFPTVDFTTSLPSGNPNYSTLAATTNRTYIRAFKDTDLVSHAIGTLRLTGITKAQLYNRDVRVYIKAPTQTGWLDLTRDYNYASFTGANDDGCWVDRDIQSGSDFKFTLGSFYTQNSGYMVIVKIVYPSSSSPRISHMAVIDW